jgi:hypothetical protein
VRRSKPYLRTRRVRQTQAVPEDASSTRSGREPIWIKFETIDSLHCQISMRGKLPSCPDVVAF